MDGWGVMEEAAELARRGEAFALATVVWRQGPSSSQQGSRAIITAAGELHGWIGGACAEPAVIREAQRVIASGEAKLLLLGSPEQFGGAVPDGMTVVPDLLLRARARLRSTSSRYCPFPTWWSWAARRWPTRSRSWRGPWAGGPT